MSFSRTKIRCFFFTRKTKKENKKISWTSKMGPIYLLSRLRASCFASINKRIRTKAKIVDGGRGDRKGERQGPIRVNFVWFKNLDCDFSVRGILIDNFSQRKSITLKVSGFVSSYSSGISSNSSIWGGSTRSRNDNSPNFTSNRCISWRYFSSFYLICL